MWEGIFLHPKSTDNRCDALIILRPFAWAFPSLTNLIALKLAGFNHCTVCCFMLSASFIFGVEKNLLNNF
ncbi:MAG: hypothetical protein ACFFC7_27655 [Candidatus Hermodarchaeota archaeon]